MAREKKVGSKLSFRNVRTRRSTSLPIEGIMKRSNKKGRTIGIAFAHTRNGEKVYQIVSNEKRKVSRRRKSSKRKSTRRKSSKRH